MLAASRGIILKEMKPKSPKDRIICFCYNISEQTILEAIRSGSDSLMAIRRDTYASSGCAGCSEEVKKLIRKYAEEHKTKVG